MFEHSLQYQFVVFFDVVDAAPPAQPLVLALASHITERVGGVDPMQLKLRAPTVGQTLTVVPGIAGPQQSVIVTWAAATGVWRMEWTPLRLDVFFDALVHAEGANADAPEPVPFSRASSRIAPNMARVGEMLRVPITRAAVVLTGESVEHDPSAAAILVRRFRIEAAREDAEAGLMPDVTVRLNRQTAWDLEGFGPRRINRLETGTAHRGPLAPGPKRDHLTWQYDVNTSPETTTRLAPPALRDFFAKAAREVETHVEEMQTHVAH